MFRLAIAQRRVTESGISLVGVCRRCVRGVCVCGTDMEWVAGLFASYHSQ